MSLPEELASLPEELAEKYFPLEVFTGIPSGVTMESTKRQWAAIELANEVIDRCAAEIEDTAGYGKMPQEYFARKIRALKGKS